MSETDEVNLAEIDAITGPGPFVPGSVYGMLRALAFEARRDRAEIARLRAENERLKMLVGRQLGECVGCNYTDGPDEYCPHHGRSYNDMLDVTQRIITADRAERDAARAEAERLREQIDEARRAMDWRMHPDAQSLPLPLWQRHLAAALTDPSEVSS